MSNNYRKAYVEVLEILKYIAPNERKKLPDEIIDVFKQNLDVNYEYRIDTMIAFEEQNLLDETKSILALLFRDYWATDSQREQILLKEKLEISKQNEELARKYNPEDLFKNKTKNYYTESKEIVLYEREKWYKKFLRFIKKI